MASPPQRAPEPPPSADLTGSTIGRYLIQSLLGSGGQGEVYRALDQSLHRTVALKRLSPALRLDERYRQRFLREAQRASGLNDPHIAGIYDVLENNGDLLLVMEYVEGASLRQRLREPLALPEFLKIATQCCEALIAAHGSGVVHRDIKPENIMLTQHGRIKVLDFGVAKQLPTEDEPEESNTTETKAGQLSGTPAYMAPEVLLERTSDERADIFSLGVVFYEALAGRHPFMAPGLVATVDRILHEPPKPIREWNPKVPPGLERIVLKMLEKDPAKRYASARELLTELRQIEMATPRRFSFRTRNIRIAVLSVVLLIAVATGLLLVMLGWKLKNVSGSQTLPAQKYIAVLPFRAIGGDAEQQAYAEGLTETVTAKLTQFTARHELQVAPAGEIHAHKIADLDQAHKELGVNLIVDGSLHASGGVIRVVYSLIDTDTRQQVRAETVTADASDPFLIEDKTVEGVLRMLGIQVQEEERDALSTHRTNVRGAYDFYLRGRGMLEKEDNESLEAAIDLFNRALVLDSKYAPAYAGLGESFWRKYESSKQQAWVNGARQSCNRAVALDSRLAAGHLCLGTLADGTGQYKQAVAEFKNALGIEPTSDAAYLGLGKAYEHLNRPSDAEQTYQQAIGLRPHYTEGYRWLGVFYLNQARYKEAAEQFEKAISIVPQNSRAINRLGVVYLYLGRYQDAISTFEKAIALTGTVHAYSNLGTAYLDLRQFDKAIPAFEQATLLDGSNFSAVSNLARAYYWSEKQRSHAPAMYKRAIDLGKQQLRVNPKDAEVHILLAQDLAMIGDRQQAFAHLDHGLKLRPDFPEFLLVAAVVHNQFGERRRALNWLRRSVARGYSAAEIRNAIELDNLRDDPQFQAILGPVKKT